MGGKSLQDRDMGGGASSARASAVDLMIRALTVLDHVGPLHAAATLALAIEQAGGMAGSPPAG